MRRNMAKQLQGLMPISCHFRDCKALLAASLTHVSSTIKSTGLYLYVTCLTIPGKLTRISAATQKLTATKTFQQQQIFKRLIKIKS